MHDFLQIGTLAVVLFGIMRSRYDANSLHKEIKEFRIELHEEMDGLRTDVHRSTTLVTQMLFEHAERITRLEKK